MNQKFKVGVGIPCLLVGGTEMQTLQLVKAIKILGFQVEVFCYFEFDAEMVRLFEDQGVKVLLLNYDRNSGTFKFIFDFKTFLKGRNIDIFHVQYMAPGALPILAARLAGIRKVIATVHQPYTPSHGKFSKRILNLAAKFCDTFIAVSKSAEESWFGSTLSLYSNATLETLPRHFTIYNAVDVAQIEAIGSSEISSSLVADELNDNQVIIGSVARLSTVKGIDIVLRSFGEVLKKHSNARLWIVGDGEEKVELYSLADQLNIRSQVVFFGKKDWEEAMKILSKMDIVILASRFEAFGLAAAEALVLQKPLVVSDTFGLKEIVQHEETGLIFPVGDVQALADSIERLIIDPSLRNKLGIQGAREVKAKFNQEVFRAQIEQLYSLLANKLAI